jgi:hypothetical protein
VSTRPDALVADAGRTHNELVTSRRARGVPK